MQKLTKMFVANVKPPEKGQIIYRDTALVGLGLRVTPAGCKSCIVEGRVNGVFRRITLGRESQLTPTAARKKAQKLLATMATGKDPTVEKSRKKIRGVTLYVFPGRDKRHHLVDSDHVIQGMAKKANCPFMIHDLRRTFLTVAERLALSYVVLKKLANHSGNNDTTFGYVVVEVERLREPMQKITNEFLRLWGVGHNN